jgi:mannose-6-phosphate isomerase
MSDLYPLRMRPVLRRYLWGGRRLGLVLGKEIGPESDYAESWEVVDHGVDQSTVEAGPLAGATLAELVREFGPQLLGRHAPQTQFPLLFKFLDAHAQLSVQVHPNDSQAAQLEPPDLGKTEAWYILAAEPGSYIYAGLQPGCDRETLARAIEQGTCEDCLCRIEPKAGECFFLPAGVVHALGPGLLVAEIQQSSDTTYRIYDWNRLGPDGRPRKLHVQEALAVIDFTTGPVQPQIPQPTSLPHVTRMAACDKFVLDQWYFDRLAAAGGDDRCHILAVLSGKVTIAGDVSDKPLERGDVALLPAEAGQVLITPSGSCEMLDAYLP